MTGGVLDDFATFQKAAIDCGLPHCDADMATAHAIWKWLDPELKKAALAGLYKRAQCGEYSDAAFLPLPQNYLSKRLWTRPLRVKAKRLPTQESMRMLFPTPAPETVEELDAMLKWADAEGLPTTTGAELIRAEEMWKMQVGGAR